jgi:hypothetical protein
VGTTRGYQAASVGAPCVRAPWPAQGRRTPATGRYGGVAGACVGRDGYSVYVVAYSQRRDLMSDQDQPANQPGPPEYTEKALRESAWQVVQQSAQVVGELGGGIGGIAAAVHVATNLKGSGGDPPAPPPAQPPSQPPQSND